MFIYMYYSNARPVAKYYPRNNNKHYQQPTTTTTGTPTATTTTTNNNVALHAYLVFVCGLTLVGVTALIDRTYVRTLEDQINKYYKRPLCLGLGIHIIYQHHITSINYHHHYN